MTDDNERIKIIEPFIEDLAKEERRSRQERLEIEWEQYRARREI